MWEEAGVEVEKRLEVWSGKIMSLGVNLTSMSSDQDWIDVLSMFVVKVKPYSGIIINVTILSIAACSSERV